MKFAPKSEEEVSNLIPKGEHAFEVLEADERQSKKGNDMIALKLGISYGDSLRGVFDYLVDIDSMAYKTRHFADTVGMLAEYEKGTLNGADLIGLTGFCKLDIEPANDQFGPKNVVKDYVKRVGSTAAPAAFAPKAANGAARDKMDDEIPF